MCRISYTLKNNKIVSKKSAGQWCLENENKEWRLLIKWALREFRKSDNEFKIENAEKLTRKFVDYTEKKLGHLSQE
jgi:hypothetical protein